MHVGHLSGAICHAKDCKSLSVNHLVGLLLHEFGHLATGGGEREADVWAFERLGVVIQYRSPILLEWVDDEAVARLLG